MNRWVSLFVQNVDATVPLLLGVTVSLLGLLGVVQSDTVDASILLALAVIAFALLRDRWDEESAYRTAKEDASKAHELLDAVRAGLAPLSGLGPLITRMQGTFDGLATVKTLRGPDITEAFGEARLHTDRWLFKGGTGTYMRAVTLPRCLDAARQQRRPLQVRLEILDPAEVALCQRYTRYRTSLSSGPDGTGEVWTLDRTRKESYSMLLAACWYRQNFQPLLDIEVGLASTMSTFRFDLSSSMIIITQDTPTFPAIMITNSSPLYDGFITELNTSFSQVRRAPLESAFVLSTQPTEAQVRALFDTLGVPLPAEYDSDDIGEIITKALHAKNPYV